MKKEHTENKDAGRNKRDEPSRDADTKSKLPPDDQHTPGEEGEQHGGGLRGA
jgi:hypothetical protein